MQSSIRGFPNATSCCGDTAALRESGHAEIKSEAGLAGIG